MTCGEFAELLPEAARNAGNIGDGRAFDRATAHAASCEACRQKLEAQRAVTSELHDLAMADSALAPSAGCEATLLAAYRMERRPIRDVRDTSRNWLILAAGAMAAAVLLFLGVALRITRDSLPFGGAGSKLATVETPAVTDDEAVAGDEDATEFVAFYPGAEFDPGDAGALVRVQVPASTLSAYGFTLPGAAPDAADDLMYNADLLVGVDGAPRAIRFVGEAGPNTADSQAAPKQGSKQ
jgi:hypothetical protein